MIGTTELLLIGGLALLVFGGKKVPEMMRGLGQGVKEFKRGMKEGEENLKAEDDKAKPTESNESNCNATIENDANNNAEEQ